MPLPDTVAVKYTEEEAEYVSMRPIVRQTFRGAELIDMILGVTGKDLARIQQILRSGTVVFHSYRYWWQGFEAEPDALELILAGYPEPDPSRTFRPEECTEAILESAGNPPRHSIHIRRNDASKRHLLRARSFWDALLVPARENPPAYRDYSYASRADVYSLALAPGQIVQLAAAVHLGPRRLRAQLAVLSAAASSPIARITYLCPRTR
jgi:hypothetical protein